MGRIVWGAAAWLCFMGFYLFLSGTVDAVELGAAIIAASLATALLLGIAGVSHRHFRFAIPAKAVLPPLVSLVPECLIVGRELIAVAVFGTTGQRGAFVRQAFRPGGSEATSVARRAVVVLGVSLAPRTFVIRGERQDSLLLHSLPSKTPSADLDWPA